MPNIPMTQSQYERKKEIERFRGRITRGTATDDDVQQFCDLTGKTLDDVKRMVPSFAKKKKKVGTYFKKRLEESWEDFERRKEMEQSRNDGSEKGNLEESSDDNEEEEEEEEEDDEEETTEPAATTAAAVVKPVNAHDRKKNPEGYELRKEIERLRKRVKKGSASEEDIQRFHDLTGTPRPERKTTKPRKTARSATANKKTAATNTTTTKQQRSIRVKSTTQKSPISRAGPLAHIPVHKLTEEEKAKEKKRLQQRIRRNSASQEDKERYLQVSGKSDLSHLKIDYDALEKDRLYHKIKNHVASKQEKKRYLELTGKSDLSHVPPETKGDKKRRLQYYRDYKRGANPSNKQKRAKRRSSDDYDEESSEEDSDQDSSVSSNSDASEVSEGSANEQQSAGTYSHSEDDNASQSSSEVDEASHQGSEDEASDGEGEIVYFSIFF